MVKKINIDSVLMEVVIWGVRCYTDNNQIIYQCSVPQRKNIEAVKMGHFFDESVVKVVREVIFPSLRK